VIQQFNKKTSLTASLVLTAFASTGTSVVWNGLPFIAKRDYAFTETENLALYLLISLVYVVGAMTSGIGTRLLRAYCSTRTIIGVLLVIQTVIFSLPLFFSSAWIIWCAGGVAGACSAWLWPTVESYLVAGRHGKDMRRSIGWWNLVWMTSVAGVMIAMAPMMDKHASMVIVCLGAMNIFAVGVLPWYGKNPIEHDEEIAKEHVPETYRGLLKGARVLLPLSYAINGILAPLLPYVLSGLGVAIFWQTPLASVWMISRVVMTALLWHFATWHGRWSVLWIAIATMAIGFIGILSATELSMLIIGLVLFGAGMGITYYAALYYAMAVGQAKVDAGGTHEAFIGGGYMVGPIVGLISIQPNSYAQVTSYQTIIIIVLSLLFLATGALALFWRKAR